MCLAWYSFTVFEYCHVRGRQTSFVPVIKRAVHEVQDRREKHFSRAAIQNGKIMHVRHLFFTGLNCIAYSLCEGPKRLRICLPSNVVQWMSDYVFRSTVRYRCRNQMVISFSLYQSLLFLLTHQVLVNIYPRSHRQYSPTGYGFYSCIHCYINGLRMQ